MPSCATEYPRRSLLADLPVSWFDEDGGEAEDNVFRFFGAISARCLHAPPTYFSSFRWDKVRMRKFPSEFYESPICFFSSFNRFSSSSCNVRVTHKNVSQRNQNAGNLYTSLSVCLCLSI